MRTKFKRRKYFVHPSSQFKYIAFSILPALIMSLACTYFLLKAGGLILQTQKEDHFVEISSITQAIYALETEGCPKDTVEELRRLINELLPMQTILAMTHFDTISKWEKTRLLIFAGLFSILLGVGILALFASHRIAGPLVRIRSCVDMLCEGRDIPPIKLRKHDEFQELAESLDKLRRRLKEGGLLESD
jgi:HAMP domain-containing protein